MQTCDPKLSAQHGKGKWKFAVVMLGFSVQCSKGKLHVLMNQHVIFWIAIR